MAVQVWECLGPISHEMRRVPTQFRGVLLVVKAKKHMFFAVLEPQTCPEPVGTRRIASFPALSGFRKTARSQAPGTQKNWPKRFCRNYKKTVVQATGAGLAAGLVGLGWAGLGWAGLGWAGLGWAGLGWAGLGGLAGLAVFLEVWE